LVLRFNALQSFTAVLSSLLVLDLAHNALITLGEAAAPGALQGYSRLVELDLSANKLTLPNGDSRLALLATLAYLTLNDNLIGRLHGACVCVCLCVRGSMLQLPSAVRVRG
jgi:Leucine-rich repeat (LRR) protein